MFRIKYFLFIETFSHNFVTTEQINYGHATSHLYRNFVNPCCQNFMPNDAQREMEIKLLQTIRLCL